MRVFRRQQFKSFFHALRYPALFILKYKMSTSDNRLFSVDRCRDPVGHNIIDFGMMLLVNQIFPFCRIHNCLCHGVGEMFFHTRRQLQQFVRFFIDKGDHIHYGRLCFCKGSGFIKYDRVGLRHCFQIFSAFDGHAVGICLPDSR